MQLLYSQVLRQYMVLCEKCQETSGCDGAGELSVLETAEHLINTIRSQIIPLIISKSVEMRNAMTDAVSPPTMCESHHLGPNMGISFMNWLSHRVSEMGHTCLKINNKACMKLGSKNFDAVEQNVRECVQIYLANKILIRIYWRISTSLGVVILSIIR